MRLLLDTCSLLWALNAPRKLCSAARLAMEDSKNHPCFAALILGNLFEVILG
jgi:PIN domain nuclease of toxin-antitoxin system